MKFARALPTLFIGCCLSAYGGTYRAQALPPVEAFGQLPFISDTELSPDGKYFAGVQSLDGKPVAVIYKVSSSDAPQVFGSPEGSLVTGIEWAKNDRLLIFYKSALNTIGGQKSSRYLPLATWYRTISVDVAGTDPVELFEHTRSMSANYAASRIQDKVPDDPDSILMPLWTLAASNVGYGDRYDFYKVNVRTGDAEKILGGVSKSNKWITDGLGNVVGRVTETMDPLTDHLFFYRNGDWQPVMDFDADPGKGSAIYGETWDARSLAVVRTGPTGYDEIDRLDLDTGKLGEVLFKDSSYDIAGPIFDEWTGRIVGARVAHDSFEYHYFEPSMQALQRGVEAQFPGLDARVESLDRSRDKAIVMVESPTLPPTLYFLDRTTHVATKIASTYPALNNSDLGQMRPYPYKARDGLKIAAFLTLPPGKNPTKLPLVVLVHGGPDARDVLGFDWWGQFLANRGYAVLQTNYRGSSGYGAAYTTAGLQQWGLKMQDDISDGVKQLVADGVADPKRVCIVGANYGGYAALAGATFTPDLYACAVSFAGISDLTLDMRRMLETWNTKSAYYKFWASRIGDPMSNWNQLVATSPALHADQVKAPILIMHGANDTTVPIEQSEAERDALVRAGKSVQFERVEGDDHYFTLASTRIEMLSKLEAFLAANIGH